MAMYEVDPRRDHRWAALLEKHPDASVFHSPEWLAALERTYGYEPVVYTTSPLGSPLIDGILISRVDSWLTGRRMVSLPFSDHCQPLLDCQDKFKNVLAALQPDMKKKRWSYLKIRPLDSTLQMPRGWDVAETFHWHRLSLKPSLEDIVRRFHKDSIQRTVLRAEREGLAYNEGRAESLLTQFYGLLLLTRRRHPTSSPKS